MLLAIAFFLRASAIEASFIAFGLSSVALSGRSYSELGYSIHEKRDEEIRVLVNRIHKACRSIVLLKLYE